ncbi:BNR/Asp-box repeat domain protein [Richelia sinica FACHB-800]|uniref:BNR/Asp-box repeat domain protein n=1 Tax=Richelia sinica FACHB-800 TaxID=1357546 RepID=A0A975T6Z2_9NOST|nr:YCF48-related protein [Richelia sinica]MBD2666873.1 glycosyl hydrolase [Richelia sinica FACHB-800]QXE23060.1 BNR/Asp-box repeat domain protein [Richelia sinica FACHB-800]
MKNILSLFKHLSYAVFIVFIVLCLHVNTALAHRPHDVVSQVDISPNYPEDKTLFIIVRSNLFKSNNGGESWKRIVQGLDNHFDLNSLVILHSNKKILFVSSAGDGIYKSDDEGESWKKTNQGLENLDIDLLTVPTEDPNIILAAGLKKGLYKTKDGGNNWYSVIKDNTKITAIGFSPKNIDFLAIGDEKGNLYLSKDRGETWERKGVIKNSGSITAIAISSNSLTEKNLFIGTEKKGVLKTNELASSFSEINQGLADKNIRDIEIATDKGQKLALWVSTADEGTFQSKNGGNSWQKYSDGLTKDSQADDIKSPHFGDISISPSFSQDKTIFIAGFNGLFKSTNGGEKWQELETLAKGTITALAVSPNYEKDGNIVAVTYVGNIYLSQDRGTTWKTINKGLEVPRLTENFKKPHQDPRRYFDVDFSPHYREDANIFATILWDKFLKSSNQGDNWEIVNLPNVKGYSTRGMTIIPSPNIASDKTIYVGTQYGVIYQSIDQGRHFSVISKVENRGINEALALVISPDFSSDKTLYASGLKGIYKSVDGGKNWQLLTASTSVIKPGRIQLAISPNYKQDRTVIAGTEDGLLITKDAGKTWIELSGIYGRHAYIEGIAISPNYQSDRTFLVSTRGRGLFKTIDGGVTFTKVRNDGISLATMNNVPSAGKSIAFSPNYASDQTIFGFGSSTTEVYKSTNGGNTWQIISLPKNDENHYDLVTSIGLWLYVYRIRVVKLLLAVIVSLVSYFIFGYLGLDKKLPLNKSQVKILGSAILLLVVLIFLYL